MLQENLKLGTLKNRFWVRLNRIEEEIELGLQTRRKIDNVEELKEEVEESEFKSVKILQDLNYEKHDEIIEIAKIETRLEKLEISKE